MALLIALLSGLSSASACSPALKTRQGEGFYRRAGRTPACARDGGHRVAWQRSRGRAASRAVGGGAIRAKLQGR